MTTEEMTLTSQAEARRHIDQALRRAVETGEVPGVVALAASEEGPIYQGAFGVRCLDAGPTMTLDTVFRIFSMTKAITCVAALQLVEAGRLRLDAPVPDIGEPALARPQVLDGFDAAGRPLLRPARRPITLRHLMTHTAGFTYEFWNRDMARYVETTGAPPIMSGTLAAYRRPLSFDPGERWEYGINIDWVGRIVEAVSGQKLDAYMRDRIFAPLGMRDTGFTETPGAAQPAGEPASAPGGRQPRAAAIAAARSRRILRRRRRAPLDRPAITCASCACCCMKAALMAPASCCRRASR